jgi:hypothetical protein
MCKRSYPQILHNWICLIYKNDERGCPDGEGEVQCSWLSCNHAPVSSTIVHGNERAPLMRKINFCLAALHLGQCMTLLHARNNTFELGKNSEKIPEMRKERWNWVRELFWERNGHRKPRLLALPALSLSLLICFSLFLFSFSLSHTLCFYLSLCLLYFNSTLFSRVCSCSTWHRQRLVQAWDPLKLTERVCDLVG